MYIFGGDTGITYDQLQQRRKMVERLRKENSRVPRNAGEGIHAIARALVARGVDRQNAEAERKIQDSLSDAYKSVLSSLGGGGGYGTDSASYGSYTAPEKSVPEQYGLDMGTPADIADQLKNPSVEVSGKTYDMGRDVDSEIEQYRNAIAGIESAGSGDYAAVGPTHPEMGRALGRYQIMEANIGPWSREALGREVTPQEFMASPKIQDAIFDHKFGGYVKRFGPDGAAQAWFAGPGGVGKTGRRDSLGTSVADYTNKFRGALGGQPQGVRTAQAGGIDPSIIQISQLLSHPALPEGQRMVLGALLQQKMTQMQPQQPDYKFIDGIGMVDMNNPSPELMAGQFEGESFADPVNVQSSEILHDGTTVAVMKNGETQVRDSQGNLLDGEARAKAISEARAQRARDESQIYGARVRGANIAERETAGPAAAAAELGKKQATFVENAIKGADAVAGSLNNINTAIAALDAGGKSGPFERYIPNVTESSATLRNAMDRMGLDVIGSVTFGALSEGELRLAMETAVPRNLDEPQLREWLVKKRDAQQKVRVALMEQAQFLSDPDNSLNDWVKKVKRDESDTGGGQSPETDTGGGQSSEADTGAGQSGEITFEQFKNDPSAQAAAKKYGVTLEEMWELKQEGMK